MPGSGKLFRMHPFKIVLLIVGVVVALAGVGSVTAGGFVLGVYSAHGAPSGFFAAPTKAVGSNGFAVTVPDINEQLTSAWGRWGLAQARTTVRVTASSQVSAPVFVGVAPTPQVSEYVSGVSRNRIRGIDLMAGSVQYDQVNGTTRPAPPQQQAFWTAKATGTGSQTLEWALRDGDWALVIMNGDASAPVAADVELSARFGMIYPLITTLILGGFVLLALGAGLMISGRSRPALSAPARTVARPRAPTHPR